MRSSNSFSRYVARVTWLCILSVWTLAAVSEVTATTMRTAMPMRDFAVVETPTLFFNITSPASLKGSVAFQPTIAGGPFPVSNRSDFTVDMRIMLPHAADDVSGCSGPWRSMNEYNQSFAGAFILVQQSSCSYANYLMASYSGAAGLIIYGCPGSAPYNCETRLTEILVYTPMSIPVIGIASADGQAIVNYLTSLKANGNVPSTSAVTIRVMSTGNIVPAERTALIAIMSQTVMSAFAGGTVPETLPLWTVQRFSNMALDPCRDRVKGLWCEAGRVVFISVFYHAWYAYAGLPKEFGVFTQLRYLNIQANALSGGVPAEWCALTELRSLWADSQYVPVGINSLPSCIGAWSKLQELRLVSNAVAALPAQLSLLSSLRTLALARNSITSLPALDKLDSLQSIDVYLNKISGPMPTFSKKAPIKYISLGANQFSGLIPADLFDGMSSLLIVDLNTNNFHGVLPNFVGCVNLTTIDLSSQVSANNTGFTGSTPDSWGGLLLVTTLNLQQNSLVSPVSFARMVSLQTIDLSENLLTTATAADPLNNEVGLFLDTVSSPSTITLRVSHNKLRGPFTSLSFALAKSFRDLIVDNNMIESVPKEIMANGVIRILDFSYNNISRVAQPAFMISDPAATMEYIDFRGNPNYAFDVSELPAWVVIDAGKVQQPGEPYACSPLKATVAERMNFYVDPSFYKYAYCSCQQGTIGAAPLCSYVPSAAQLNPYHIIISDEIGSTFPELLTRTHGVGGAIYANTITTTDSTNATSANNTASTNTTTAAQQMYSQAFSDSMYGDSRLTLGLATSWVVNLTNLYSEDIDAYTANRQVFPDTTTVYQVGPTDLVSSLWTPVRTIVIRLHISSTLFTQFEDMISVYEGGKDLKGTRVYSIRGTDAKASMTYSAYAQSSEYMQLYNDSLSQIQSPFIVEVRVFSPVATVAFNSRTINGLHFVATYSYDFVCPTGYFYDTVTSNPARCRLNREIFFVGTEIRTAVFAVTAVALAFVLFNIVMLLLNWNSPVYKAASRVFMLLTLIFLLSLGLGALLYASIPQAYTHVGASICIGRPWLSCLPLAGILGVLLAKSSRLNSIFGSTSLQVKAQTDLDILKVVLVVVALQIGMLAIFSGLPLSRAVRAVGKGSLSDELVDMCSQESGFMSWIGAEIAFIACLMLPAAYLGFKCRDLPSQYNESSHIQNALILLIFFAVIIVPLDIFIQDNPEAAVLIQGLGQAFLCIVLTNIIFSPKLYYLFVVNSRDPAGRTQLATDLSSSSTLTGGVARGSLKVGAPQKLSASNPRTSSLKTVPNVSEKGSLARLHSTTPGLTGAASNTVHNNASFLTLSPQQSRSVTPGQPAPFPAVRRVIRIHTGDSVSSNDIAVEMQNATASPVSSISTIASPSNGEAQISPRNRKAVPTLTTIAADDTPSTSGSPTSPNTAATGDIKNIPDHTTSQS